MNALPDYDAFEKPKATSKVPFLLQPDFPLTKNWSCLSPLESNYHHAYLRSDRSTGTRAVARGYRTCTIFARRSWRFRGEGLVSANGDAFEIEFMVNSQASQRTLLLYVERLKRLGILGRIRLLENAQYMNLRRNNKSDAVFGSLAISFPPDLEVPAYVAREVTGLPTSPD